MQNEERAHGTHSLNMYKRKTEHDRSSECDASDSYKKFLNRNGSITNASMSILVTGQKVVQAFACRISNWRKLLRRICLRLPLGWFGWFFGFNRNEFVKTAANEKESAGIIFLHVTHTTCDYKLSLAIFPCLCLLHAPFHQMPDHFCQAYVLKCRTVEIYIFCACKNCRPHKMWRFFLFHFSFSFILLISMDVCIYLHKNSRGKHTKLKLKQHEFKYDEKKNHTYTQPHHSHQMKNFWRVRHSKKKEKYK